MKPLLIFLIYIPYLLSAQPSLQWQRTYGGTDYDEPEMIQKTSDNGFLVTGTAVSNDGDVGPNFGYADYWTIKLDSAGNVIWKNLVGGSDLDYALAMQATRDGGSIIAGFSRSNDGSVSGNHGGTDAWIVKLDASGNLQWQKCYGGSGREEAWDIKQTPEGGYIFVGQSSSTDGDVTAHYGDRDYWVVKIDSMGNIAWQKSYGGTFLDLGYAIDLTEDGGYIVAGETNSNDGDVTNLHGNADYWVVKLNFEGKIEWEKTLGGGNLDRANDVIEIPNEGYVVFGQARSNNGDVTGAHGAYDNWVVKLDKSGEIIWEYAYGGSGEDFGKSIARTGDGGFITIGTSRSNNGDVTGNHGGTDIWLLRLDPNGEKLWQLSLGGSLTEWGSSIYPLSDDEFVLCGYAWSNNGDVSGVDGKNDYWIVKLTTPSSNTHTLPIQNLTISPNPARDWLQCHWPEDESSMLVRVSDALGRVVLEQQLASNTQLNVSRLLPGVYTIHAIGASGKNYAGRFIRE